MKFKIIPSLTENDEVQTCSDDDAQFFSVFSVVENPNPNGLPKIDFVEDFETRSDAEKFIKLVS